MRVNYTSRHSRESGNPPTRDEPSPPVGASLVAAPLPRERARVRANPLAPLADNPICVRSNGSAIMPIEFTKDYRGHIPPREKLARASAQRMWADIERNGQSGDGFSCEHERGGVAERTKAPVLKTGIR